MISRANLAIILIVGCGPTAPDTTDTSSGPQTTASTAAATTPNSRACCQCGQF